MKKSQSGFMSIIVIIILALIIIGGGMYYISKQHNTSNSTSITPGQYKNDQYKFSVAFPTDLDVYFEEGKPQGSSYSSNEKLVSTPRKYVPVSVANPILKIAINHALVNQGKNFYNFNEPENTIDTEQVTIDGLGAKLWADENPDGSYAINVVSDTKSDYKIIFLLQPIRSIDIVKYKEIIKNIVQSFKFY
jgi:hypothetical protein